MTDLKIYNTSFYKLINYYGIDIINIDINIYMKTEF